MSEKGSEAASGCGLAAYAMVLLAVCLTGVLGIVFSTINLLSNTPDEISRLVHGSEVQVWRLQPMREAGVLSLTEVPLAWHDESPRRDGTTVCALRAESVVRVQDGEAMEIPYGDIQDLTPSPDPSGGIQVEISGAKVRFPCRFGPEEGVESFMRQLEIERTRNR